LNGRLFEDCGQQPNNKIATNDEKQQKIHIGDGIEFHCSEINSNPNRFAAAVEDIYFR